MKCISVLSVTCGEALRSMAQPVIASVTVTMAGFICFFARKFHNLDRGLQNILKETSRA